MTNLQTSLRYYARVHPTVQQARQEGRKGVREVDVATLHAQLAAEGHDITQRGLYNSLADMVKRKHAGYETWLANGLPSADDRATPATDYAAVGAWPMESQQFTVSDIDRVPLGETAQPPVLTIALGDTQFGEREFLLPAWEWFCAEVVARARERRPASIKLLLLGDMITGGGVFRDQALSVLLAVTDPQTAYAAGKVLDLYEDLSAIAPTRIIAIRGNHDVDQGKADLALELVKTLHLLGADAVYGGRRAFVNIAPEGARPYVVLLDHGKGNSSFQAASHAHIRDLKDYLVQSGLWQRIEGGAIHRVVSGHTHWLAVAMDLAGVKLDVVGGWTRPERHGLGGALRPVGGLMYTHNGAGAEASTVRPPDSVMLAAADAVHLHTDNLADIAAGLRAAAERLMEMGLVASGTERLL